jgi:phage terminase large subunit-like protein
MTDLDLSKLSPDEKRRLRWLLERRDNQKVPPGNWMIWVIQAGRGFGKTRTGAEWVAEKLRKEKNVRIACVVKTFADGRDICIEGESGLESVLAKNEYTWNRSEGLLKHVNGGQVKIYQSMEPERLRGPQHHYAWCDEFCKWARQQETWDQLMFGLRLGKDPRVIITTTPKSQPLFKDIIKRPNTIVTSGSTYDNAVNLAPPALEELIRRYAGSTLGIQELEGKIVDEVAEALWRRQWVHDNRLPMPDIDEFARIAVAVDPAGSHNASADQTGIVVVGVTGSRGEREGWVIEDATHEQKVLPAVWGRTAVDMAVCYQADIIAYERNYGGDMVAHTIEVAADELGVRDFKLEPVWASQGKRLRAEPLSVRYQHGRVHHTNVFQELEDEMCTWVPGDPSPNRMDALVWAFDSIGFTEAAKRSRKLKFAA